MSANPLLSDLQATKARYQAGDRIVAKIRTMISVEQHSKLRASIIKFAGAEINLLVLNCARFHVVRIRQGEQNLIISQLSGVTDESKLGLANVDLAKVEFQRDDKLIVSCPVGYDEKHCINAFKIWAGNDVEVIIAHWT